MLPLHFADAHSFMGRLRVRTLGGNLYPRRGTEKINVQPAFGCLVIGAAALPVVPGVPVTGQPLVQFADDLGYKSYPPRRSYSVAWAEFVAAIVGLPLLRLEMGMQFGRIPLY